MPSQNVKFIRNVIYSPHTPGIAAENPPDGKPCPLEKAVFSQCFKGIGRAGRVIFAAGRKKRWNYLFINLYQTHKQVFHYKFISVLKRAESLSLLWKRSFFADRLLYFPDSFVFEISAQNVAFDFCDRCSRNNNDIYSQRKQSFIFHISLSDDTFCTVSHNGIPDFFPCGYTEHIERSVILSDVNNNVSWNNTLPFSVKIKKCLVFIYGFCIKHNLSFQHAGFLKAPACFSCFLYLRKISPHRNFIYDLLYTIIF